jgi:hypothetical protein
VVRPEEIDDFKSENFSVVIACVSGGD